MQRTFTPYTPKPLPLVLPPELVSNVSDSTDSEPAGFPFGRFAPKFVPPFWGDFHISPAKPSPREASLGKSHWSPMQASRLSTAHSAHPKPFSPRPPHCPENHVLDLSRLARGNRLNFCPQKMIFPLRCARNCIHKVEATYLAPGEVILRFLDEDKRPAEIAMEPSLKKRRHVVLEYLRFVALVRDAKLPNQSRQSPKNKAKAKRLVMMFTQQLGERNRFAFSVNYEHVRNAMMDFFKNKPVKASLGLLNDFELLFFGVFLLKKNFADWSDERFDLAKLQRSETKKRKEHFLKFLLKKLFKHLSAKKQHFFGDKNKDITDRMKSIFFEGQRRTRRDPRSNRMENLGRLLATNSDFIKFYHQADKDALVRELFAEYSNRAMVTLINNHINRLKTHMDEESHPERRILRFVEYVFKLRHKKLKNMWTFTEFCQAKDVLHYILGASPAN